MIILRVNKDMSPDECIMHANKLSEYAGDKVLILDNKVLQIAIPIQEEVQVIDFEDIKKDSKKCNYNNVIFTGRSVKLGMWVYGDLVTEISTGRKFILDVGHLKKDTKTYFDDLAIEVVPETVRHTHTVNEVK